MLASTGTLHRKTLFSFCKSQASSLGGKGICTSGNVDMTMTATNGRDSDTLGPRIRKLRKARDRTLDSLAQEIGLTKGYLSKVETGRQVPPLATLSKLAKALGTDLASLVETGPRGQEPYRGISVV